MTNNILRHDKFILFFGVLSKKHFELAPVWSEYNDPMELDDISVSDEWIQSNLFSKLNLSSKRVYYSTLEIIDYSKREFLNIFCELTLAGHQLQGYLYLIQDKVNSVSIFLGDEVVDLYSSDVLSEDNLETLNQVSDYLLVSIENVSSVEYTIKNCIVSNIKSKGVFYFPVE